MDNLIAEPEYEPDSDILSDQGFDGDRDSLAKT